MGYLPIGLTTWTHPGVIAATIHLMGRVGARRIRLLESPWKSAEPLQEHMIGAGWDISLFTSAAPVVEFENTNFLGYGKSYVRLPVPRGGHLFPAYDLNHAYADCDVLVSIGKLKEHLTAGITLSMKNCFGITPCTIYGDGAPKDEPGLVPLGGRFPIHTGSRRRPKVRCRRSIPPARAKEDIACRAAWRTWWPPVLYTWRSSTAWNRRPPWRPSAATSTYVKPHLLVAGTNAVCVDAVGAAVMGFDPMADRGSRPFERCDSTLRLAEELGVGTRDLKRIEVIGGRISDLVFDYRKAGGWRPATQRKG